MQFVIFHGSFGSCNDNWFPELKSKLEALSQTVFTPQFPIEDWQELTQKGEKYELKNQNLTRWIETFSQILLSQLNRNEKICFVGHSLSSVFILHIVSRFRIKLDCAIFVSPFLDKLNKTWQIDYVNSSFYKTDFDFDVIKKLISISYVLYSDNDPYVDR